jgi:hypothetical protein
MDVVLVYSNIYDAAASLQARKTIAMLGQDFIRDGSVILTHGFSRVVLSILQLAASNKKHFSVICTGFLIFNCLHIILSFRSLESASVYKLTS